MDKLHEAYEKIITKDLSERNPGYIGGVTSKQGRGKENISTDIARIQQWMKEHIAWHKKHDRG